MNWSAKDLEIYYRKNPHLGPQIIIDPAQSNKESKYGNQKIIIDGITFDSKKEANRYCELKLWEGMGLITDLQRQVPYKLIINGIEVAKYIADFVYLPKIGNGFIGPFDREPGALIIEDVKSEFTRKMPLYRLKKKLMQAIYNITIFET